MIFDRNKQLIIFISFIIIFLSVTILNIKCLGVENRTKIYDKIEYKVIYQGLDSKIQNEKFVVINSINEWKSLWISHYIGKIIQSPDNKNFKKNFINYPKIDFVNNTIVGVFSGKRSSGGYSIYIESIKRTNNVVNIFIYENIPSSNSSVTTAITFPYQIVTASKFQSPFKFIYNFH